MKYKILALSLLAYFGVEAQQINPVPDYVFKNQMSVGRNAVTDTAAYFSVGPRFGATKGMMPPMVGDTANVSATKRNGLLIFSVQKNKYLYWDSVGVKWAEMAGTTGSAIAGTLTTNYLPKATGTSTLGNSIMYDSSGHLIAYKNSLGNTLSNRHLFTVAMDGQNGYAVVVQQNDSSDNNIQYAMSIRKNLLTSGKPRPGFGVGYDTRLPDDAGTMRRVGAQLFRLSDTTAAGMSSYMQLQLIKGGNTITPMQISADSTVRMAKLAGTGTRYVVADANGDLTATSSTSSTVGGSGTTNYIPKFTASSTIGNSQIFDDGTNVGIGTTSPTTKLFVQISGNNGIRIANTGNTGSDYSVLDFVQNGVQKGLLYTNNDVLNIQGIGLNIGTSGATNFTMYTQNTERMRIKSDGEVLIGTTTDAGAYALQVNGTTYTLGLTMPGGGYSLVYGTSNANTRITGDNSGGANTYIEMRTNGTNRLRIQEDGEILLNNISDAGAYALQVSGSIYNTGAVDLAATSGSLRIGTTTTNQIFGTSPILQVAGDAGFATFQRFQNNTFGSVVGFTKSRNTTIGSHTIVQSGDDLGRVGYFGSDGSAFQPAAAIDGAVDGTPGANDMPGRLTFFTSADGTTTLTERMRITSAGNVHIGATSDALTDAGRTLLSVNGSSNSIISMRSGGTLAGFLYANGTSSFDIVSNNIPMRFAMGASLTERMRLQSDGELLIGTTSDAGAYSLQVAGSIYNTTGAVLAASSGNVGIGTTSPTEKLTVNGAVRASSDGSSVSYYMSSGSAIRSDGMIYIDGGVSNNQGLTLRAGTSLTSFTFNQDANFGINVSSFGTSATRTFAILNGTAPSTSPTDAFQLYSADITAGNAAPHFRTENGAVIKLYQETTGVGSATFVAGTGTAVQSGSTFDGYTLQQIVKALRNQGILQ